MTLELQLEYKPVLDYWFPQEPTSIPKFWFDKNPETDTYIKTNFTDLLTKAENHQLNHWKSDIKGHLALIILLDQFSRHIYRLDDNYTKNDIIAFQYAREFILYNKDENLNNLEKIMVLMPFRHHNTIDSYKFIIKYMACEEDPIWDKFKKHTLLRYQKIEENELNQLSVDLSKVNQLSVDLSKVNQPKVDWKKYNNILENPYIFEYQLDNIVSPLTDTLTKFMITNLKLNSNNLIIVSLSGGVDSMVILTILNTIKIGLPANVTVVAVHLDYHNRPETGIEAEFLFQWCNSMNIPLYYRYIHEGIRESKNRDKYEELTKEIRFDLYKKVRDIYKLYNCMGVILGHHKGDLQENIFLNIVKGRSLTDLSVIKEQSDILGVKILRPLISHPKRDIFDIATKNNIPYFKNTTPLWSNRGQFREIIQPAIIKTFGQGVLTNLSKIGQESDELQQLIKLNIIDPYMSRIELKNEMYYLPLVPGQLFTFWKYVFHEFCHTINISLISHKLLSHIYEKLYLNNESTITCNSNIKLMIKNDYIIIKITL